LAGAFPGAITTYTNPAGSTHTATPVGGRTLSQFVSDHNDDLEAIMAKLGITLASGALNSPLTDRLMGSDANNQSGWMQLRAGMVPANLITQAVETVEASAVDVSSTSYTDVATRTITTTGGILLVFGHTNAYITSGTPGNCFMSLRLDSGADTDLDNRASSASSFGLMGWKIFTGVSAASHSLALRIANSAAGTNQTYYRQLMVLELKK
jgi:hypothetical protein